MCLLNFTHHKGSRLTGYYTFYMATATMAGMTSCVSSNIAGRTKKNVVSTIFLIGYCTGNIIGPQTFRSNQAPDYAGAKAAMLVSFIVGSICIASLFTLYTLRNRKRDQKRAELGESYVVPENVAFADLTDFENPEFRYSL
ncbi:unnamed protein product [[Candida] boidinii]|uniref:Unnamed protein product n=1 Tax=Candida boidinii TaxID=5477 RepID=A0ACB5U895_CANBO|nr:unnamed protein product [[Candida] boidinii]